MNLVLKDLQPETLWKNFESLCAIPRPSKKESKVVEFIKAFAVTHGLEHVSDHTGNVIIRKPASPGMEKHTGVILQAHLDMVPQKNNEVKHDFEKDPIQAYIDGDWVKARGTTLGADNGIGVAAALTVLQTKDLKHGPVEVLFTVDEETGMTGAFNLQAGQLKGEIFINLDSEEEGELYIGCAGGVNATAGISYDMEPTEKGSSGFKISLTGLLGGHSGLDINLGRGNANKLINRFLWNAARKYGLRLSAIEGGNMRNAIPREAWVVVVVASGKVDELKKDAKAFLEIITNELHGVESGLKFIVEPVDLPATIMTKVSQDKILNVLYALPNGAIRMVSDKPDVVETSTNLAIVKSDGKQVNVACLLRSSVDSAKDDLANSIIAAFDLGGVEVELSGSYPGWKPNFDSAILKTMKEVYQRLYKKIPHVKIIHAGLECGIFGKNYPDMDYISFGPTIMHPHSPGEKVNIPSVAMFWNYLVETLKSI